MQVNHGSDPGVKEEKVKNSKGEKGKGSRASKEGETGAAVTETKPPQPVAGPDEHIVQDGDTLSGILNLELTFSFFSLAKSAIPFLGLALQLDISARALKRLNNLSNDVLFEGQRLRIPAIRRAIAAEPEANEDDTRGEGRLVEVIDKNGGVKQVWRANAGGATSKTSPKVGGGGASDTSYHEGAKALHR